MQLFYKIIDYLKELSGRRKIAAYERHHKSDLKNEQRPHPFDVEITFDSFVQEFGGKKISDLIDSKRDMPMNADYLFREQNVIAELKTLEGIFAGPGAIKQLGQIFVDANCKGSEISDFLWKKTETPNSIDLLIRKRTRRAIEQRVVKARKQLRKSKQLLGNDETRTLILIAMDHKPLFGHGFMLSNLVTVMGDNYADKDTDGVVYFNPNTPTKSQKDGMEFSGWYPFYRDENDNEF